GGIRGRTEATGYGTIYFVDEMLKDNNLSFKNATLIASGSGNVAIYAMEKAIKLGAKVVACSDSNGYIYDANELSLQTIKRLKLHENARISEYIETHPYGASSAYNSKTWSAPCDMALPCATPTVIDPSSATNLVRSGVSVVADGANMRCTCEACALFTENKTLFG